MSGKDIAIVPAPAKTTRKTAPASHAWRCKTASARVGSATSPLGAVRVTSVSPCSRRAVVISGHDQRVAGLQEERLQLALRDDGVVVARNPRHRRALHAQDHHLRATGKIVEPARERDRIEDGRAASDVVAAGLL